MGKQQCTMFSTRDIGKDYVIISINDTDSHTKIFDNPHIKDVLKLTFDDIQEKDMKAIKESGEYNLQLCSKEDIQLIKDFIDKYKDTVNNIVVHCTAGVSRSGAIGCILARYLNGDDTSMFFDFNILPNKYVYELGCEVFSLEYNEKDIDKKYRDAYGDTNNLLKNYGISLDDLLTDK